MKSSSMKKISKRAPQNERGTGHGAETGLADRAEANEVLQAEDESLRKFSGRLLRLQDDEHRRIARDLHDITGQKLAVQSMALSQLLNSKSALLDDETRRVLSDCDTINKQVGEEIRTLSYLLHPPLLDELGLPSAVKWYAERFERRTGIRVKVDMYPELNRLPADIEMTLFRIIQESLTNVHRYSGSSEAFVLVKLVGEQIEAKIEDRGRGIHRDALNELNETKGKIALLGAGIQSMKERLRQFNGKLEIASRTNEGTVITATVPLSPQLANGKQKSPKGN